MIEIVCLDRAEGDQILQVMADEQELEVVAGLPEYLDTTQPMYSVRLQRELRCTEDPEEWLRAFADTLLSRDIYVDVTYDDEPYHALERAADIQAHEQRHRPQLLQAPTLRSWLREQWRHVEIERVMAVSSQRMQALGRIFMAQWKRTSAARFGSPRA